jgi:hypothetical protein
MEIIEKLSDITDDLKILKFNWIFSESLKGFKFSENVHTIYIITDNIKLSDIDFPKKLKILLIYQSCCDFMGVIFPDTLQKLHLRSSIIISTINLVLPPNLIELSSCGYDIKNLSFPKSLQSLELYNSGIYDLDFNHELHIIFDKHIDNPKFEFVKCDSDHDGTRWHYIYLKWPRSHFIKAARI